MALQRRPLWFSRAAAALAAAAFASGCAGSGQSSGMVPLGGAGFGAGRHRQYPRADLRTHRYAELAAHTSDHHAFAAGARWIRSADRGCARNDAGPRDAGRSDAGSARFADAGNQRNRTDDDQSKRCRGTERERLHSGAGRNGVSALTDVAGRNLYRYRRLQQCGDRIYRGTVDQQRAQPNAGRHAVFDRDHSRLVSQFRQRAGGNRLLRCRSPSGARRAARRESKRHRRQRGRSTSI